MTETIEVVMSVEQKERLERTAAAQNLTTSEFVHSILFGYDD